MANMSYCRFQNTLYDLDDCREALDETGGDLNRLSAEEKRAAIQIIKMCRRISEEEWDIEGF